MERGGRERRKREEEERGRGERRRREEEERGGREMNCLLYTSDAADE